MGTAFARARTLASVWAVAWTFTCAGARADDEDESRNDVGIFHFEAVATRWSTLPQLTLAGSDASRVLVGLHSPALGPVTTYGVGVDVGAHANWVDASLLHLRYSRSFDAGPAGSGVAEEAPVSIAMGPLNVFEIGFPMIVPPRIGTEIVGRDFKLAATFDWGLTYAWATATTVDALQGQTTGKMDAWSIYARATLAGCVRLGSSFYKDGVTWACLQASPSLYDFGWLQGQSVGLRVDL